MDLAAVEYFERLKIPFDLLRFPADSEKGAANVAHA